MFDRNWKTWLLILVVGLGTAFEALKRLPRHNKQADFMAENLKLGQADGHSPYNVRVAGNVRSQEAKTHKKVNREDLKKFIAANTPTATHFGHVEKGAEGKGSEAATKTAKKKKKVKLKDDEEWEIYIDPVTGKKYRRKRKKIANAVEEIKYEEQATKDSEKRKKDGDGDDLNYVYHNQPPQTNGQEANEADNPFLTLDEWVRRLLNRPDRAETNRFIQHYMNRLVTADIFYRIVDMMIEHPNQEMKELGAMALGSTPSVMSFQILSEIVAGQSGDTPLRQSADRYIARYSELNNLGVLEKILRAPTAKSTTILATQTLDVAARRHLSPEANKQPAQPTTSETVTAHSNSSYFVRFKVILESLIRSNDVEIKTQAQVTLASLDSLLGPTGAPAGPSQTQASVTDL